jgi:hypothetical protein
MNRGRRLILLLLVAVACGVLVWWLARGPDRAARVDADPQARRQTRPERPLPRAAPQPLWSDEGPRPAAGRLVIQGAWGAGPGQFGRKPAQESNPEAPMSLRVDRSGKIHVLDQVNRRVQRFGPDGRHLGSQSIDRDTFQDLLVDDDGRTLLLDRLAEPGIEVLGPDGRSEGRLAVVGGAVSEGGGITGLFSDDNGTYVEVGHDDLVRVADSGGKPTSLNETIPGRPSRDGKLYLKAGIISKAEGRVYVQAHHQDGQLAWETPLNLGRPVLHLLLLDSDTQGRVYLGAEVGVEDPVTHGFQDLATVVARLSSDGHLTGALNLPPTTTDPAETFQPLVVSDDGTIYHMVATAGGLKVTAYTFPS